MAKPKIIKTVMGTRGPMETRRIKQLVVRNTGQAVKDLVAKWHRYDQDTKAWISPMISIFLIMKGTAFTADSLKASKLWADADGNLKVSFRLTEDQLPFNNSSAPNVSDWVELTRLPSFTVMRGDQALSREQIESEEGLKDGACGRVVVSHQSVTRGSGVLELLPMSMANLVELINKWKVKMNSPLVPRLLVPEIWSTSRTSKSRNLPWALRELDGENIGMGVFPIIECITAEDEVPAPTQEALEKEMSALLGKFVGTVQTNKPGELDRLVAAEIPLDASAATTANWTWPKWKSPAKAKKDLSRVARSPASPQAPPQPLSLTPALPGKPARRSTTSHKPKKLMVGTIDGKYSHKHSMYSVLNLEREAEGKAIPESEKTFQGLLSRGKRKPEWSD